MVERFFVLLICYLFAESQRKVSASQRNRITQGGVFEANTANTWETRNLAVSFTTRSLSGVASPTGRGTMCGITGAKSTVGLYASTAREAISWVLIGF